MAVVFYTLITLLFLDFTGTIHKYFGWMADIQFVPALLALNVGVVVALLVLTFLFGRVYCSVICPLGVMQDVVAFFGKKSKKNRYSFSPERKWLRYSVLVIFLATILAPGVGFIAHLVAPYSAYGRIATNLFAPVYQFGNNILAYIAERAGSYAFYTVDIWVKSLTTFAIAIVTLGLIVVLAWRGGRTWCNTVCPVGTILGFFAKYSLYKPVIDTTSAYDILFCNRITGQYPYSNMFLFITIMAPDRSHQSDTLECIMADKRGKWLGRGFGNVWSYSIPYKRNIAFPMKGTYVFYIEQAMRVENLPHVLDAGLKIEKTNK